MLSKFSFCLKCFLIDQLFMNGSLCAFLIWLIHYSYGQFAIANSYLSTYVECIKYARSIKVERVRNVVKSERNHSSNDQQFLPSNLSNFCWRIFIQFSVRGSVGRASCCCFWHHKSSVWNPHFCYSFNEAPWPLLSRSNLIISNLICSANINHHDPFWRPSW